MDDPIEVLCEVAGRLKQVRISYMITGSVALSFYTVGRMTRDIDLVVELAPSDVEKFVRSFEEGFYVDREMVQQAFEGVGMFNLIHLSSGFKVDFVIRKSTEYRKQEFSRRIKTKVRDAEVDLVSIEDLVLSKLHWAKDSESEMQLNDVKELLSSGKEVDVAYLETWASKLGVKKLLEKITNEGHFKGIRKEMEGAFHGPPLRRASYSNRKDVHSRARTSRKFY